jgi:hypothetical protein
MVLSGTVVMILYRKHSDRYKKTVLPQQKESIKSLVKDLQSTTIEIVPCLTSNLSPETITILNAGEYIDNGELLSRERYDDYNILINGQLRPTFNFDRYLNTKSLPKDVRNELRSFHCTAFRAVDRTENDYFALFSEDNEVEKINTELFAGDGEAFECWLSLKECSHNLNFVIQQWVQENCESKEINHIQDLFLKKKKTYKLIHQPT